MIPVESNVVVQARTNSSCSERAQLVQHRLFCCFEFMNTRLFTIFPHKLIFSGEKPFQRRDRKDKGQRHFVTDSQAPN